MNKNASSASISNSDTLDGTKTNKAGATLVLFLLLSIALAFTAAFLGQFLRTGNIAAGIGGGLAPIIMGLIVVVFFQIGKPFRNSRSRCKILLWSQIVLILGSISNLLSYFFRGY
ncbi:hypothetical protein ACJJIP_06830 [Microbulbifer sp. VTAC004]|uniref:hypothetical protein n=1 Tax=Microbulbifer sp. VTAC004 TaxID=3243386 RepID=UPI0040391DB5